MMPVLMQVVLWSVVALQQVQRDRRFRGDEGRARILALADWEAGQLQLEYSPRWVGRGWFVLATLWTVGGLASVVATDWLAAVLTVPVVIAMVAAGLSRRRTAPQVLTVLAERDVDLMEIARESSRRRTRRTRFFLALMLVSFTAGTATLVVASSWDSTAWTVVGGGLLVIGVLALCGVGWARAWRYGDEKPVA